MASQQFFHVLIDFKIKEEISLKAICRKLCFKREIQNKQLFRVYLIYQSNQCKINSSTKFCKSENRGLKHINVIVLYPLKCVTNLVSMDIMEEIEVIKLYNRNIKRSQSFLYNVLEETEHFCIFGILKKQQSLYKTT